MKRFFVGIGWFVVLWMGTLMVGGMLAGLLAGAGVKGFHEGFEAGHAAGAAFGQKFGNLVLISALVVSSVGTFLG